MIRIVVIATCVLLMSCHSDKHQTAHNTYFNYSKPDLENAGVKMVEVQTPQRKI
jgi:hypothetical protein